jgi:hypothetical protein
MLEGRGGALCGGLCAVHFYGGRETPTNMTGMFALDSSARFKPDEFLPIWEWQYGRSGIAAVAASRKLARLASVIDIEGEVGLGQRFGRMNETEAWAALFFRWTWFPWNNYMTTTFAASTGINFATGVPVEERVRDGAGRSSKLLHFFSPEITFALPSQPQWQIVGRLHHRSGGRVVFGDVGMFNGVDGGAQFATLGVRYRF